MFFQLSNNHGRKFVAIFPGRHYKDQLNQILNVIGSPSEEDVRFIPNMPLRRYVLSLPSKEKIIWKDRYPKASPPVLDLLENLLKLNPNVRITTEECLNHPFVEQYSDPNDEPVIKSPFTFQMETNDDLTIDQLKCMIFKESQK